MTQLPDALVGRDRLIIITYTHKPCVGYGTAYELSPTALPVLISSYDVTLYIGECNVALPPLSNCTYSVGFEADEKKANVHPTSRIFTILAMIAIFTRLSSQIAQVTDTYGKTYTNFIIFLFTKFIMIFSQICLYTVVNFVAEMSFRPTHISIFVNLPRVSYPWVTGLLSTLNTYNIGSPTY